MAIDLSSIICGKSHKPPRILIHGIAKIGKTTFGANAPAPIVIQTEDGADEIGVPRFPQARSFSDVMGQLDVLATQQHEYKTLVVDSLDWLEPMVWEDTCLQNGWKTIEDPGYGKGYVAAANQWDDYIQRINYLRDSIGMTIIQICHNEIKRFEDPSSEPYDRYQIKLHKAAAGKLVEHSDAILFANFRVTTMKTDAGFGKKTTRGVSSGDRVVYTEERPAYIAGNRYSMPQELPLDWNAVASCIPFFNQQ